MCNVLATSLAANGLSMRSWQQPDGKTGDYKHKLQAYGRAGLPCLRCGQLLRQTVVGVRGTTFCPDCQQMKI